jgi:hypothetical protein
MFILEWKTGLSFRNCLSLIENLAFPLETLTLTKKLASPLETVYPSMEDWLIL